MLRERYLATRNRRIAALLTDPAKNDTERFWDAMEEMQKEAKILRYCLDGHSRSNMEIIICTMIGYDMLEKADLNEFSAELRQKVSIALGRKFS
jgi:hypothetical protein